jgi:septal ring factor EnvC (AmiA/AmiB activator)
MGGNMPATGDFGQVAQQGGGAARSETLYMELRQGKTPVDPAEWFTMTSDNQG